MTSQLHDNAARTTTANPRNRSIAGAALIGIGLLALAGQFVQADWLGLLLLPALGLIFLAWGIGTRNLGLLIPGGIVSGIGLGALLVAGPLSGIGEEAAGGVFLLCFALGWALITLFSALATARTHWWPLIPGTIMALLGGALLAGGAGLQVLSLLGHGWPLALVAFGLYLILRRKE